MRWSLPLLAALLIYAAPAGASLVSDWHDALLAADAKGVPSNFSRSAALLHVAMFDAGNAVMRRYVSYRPPPAVPYPSSAQAAAATAAHVVLSRLYPAHAAMFDIRLRTDLEAVADGPARQNGIVVGREVAERLLAERANDGWSAPSRYKADPQPGAGRYRLARMPVLSHLSAAKPFALATPDQFRPPPPPSLESAEWTRALDEVRERGAFDSPVRSLQETELARFIAVSNTRFHLDPATEALRQRKLPWLQESRLVALLAMASADALIASFEAKYHYLFWRPETALGDAWKPLVESPPHPEYPCNHCMQGAVVATWLEIFFARQPLGVRYHNPAISPQPRLYVDPQAVVSTMIDGRVNAGVHYRFSGAVGAGMGRAVAEHVFRTQLRPWARTQ